MRDTFVDLLKLSAGAGGITMVFYVVCASCDRESSYINRSLSFKGVDGKSNRTIAQVRIEEDVTLSNKINRSPPHPLQPARGVHVILPSLQHHWMDVLQSKDCKYLRKYKCLT